MSQFQHPICMIGSLLTLYISYNQTSRETLWQSRNDGGCATGLDWNFWTTIRASLPLGPLD